MRNYLQIQHSNKDCSLSTICFCLCQNVFLTKKKKKSITRRWIRCNPPPRLDDWIRTFFGRNIWMEKAFLSMNTKLKSPADLKQIRSPKSRLSMIPPASDSVCFFFTFPLAAAVKKARVPLKSFFCAKRLQMQHQKEATWVKAVWFRHLGVDSGMVLHISSCHSWSTANTYPAGTVTGLNGGEKKHQHAVDESCRQTEGKVIYSRICWKT